MTTEDKQHILTLAFVGLCSGALSSVLLFLAKDPINPFIPGIVFSLVIGLYFLSLQDKRALVSTILFIICSAASYAVAILIVYYLPLYAFIVLFAMYYIGVFVGGIIGTSLFLMSFRAFIFPLGSRDFKKLFFIGAVLALVGQIIFWSVKTDNSGHGYFSFESIYFIIPLWQIGMATALGWVISQSTQVKNSYKLPPKAIISALLLLFILSYGVYYYYINFYLLSHAKPENVSNLQLECVGACEGVKK